jgi:signal transduction histidine kinase
MLKASDQGLLISYFTLAVSDTGIGIPREHHEIIFDLYTQLPLPGKRRADKRDCGVLVVDKSVANIGRKRRRVANVGIGLAFCKACRRTA